MRPLSGIWGLAGERAKLIHYNAIDAVHNALILPGTWTVAKQRHPLINGLCALHRENRMKPGAVAYIDPVFDAAFAICRDPWPWEPGLPGQAGCQYSTTSCSDAMPFHSFTLGRYAARIGVGNGST